MIRIPEVLSLPTLTGKSLDCKIWMSRPEILTFVDQLKRSQYMLEFGCGGSTILANIIGIQTLSVENQLEFIQYTSRTISLLRKDSGSFPTPIFHHVDLGRTLSWGYPVTVTDTCNRYYEEVWDRLPDVPPDLVLVDGRFRMASILATIRNLQEVTILLHDCSREAYKGFDKFCEVEKVVDQLAVLRPKPLSPKDYERAITPFRLDPR